MISVVTPPRPHMVARVIEREFQVYRRMWRGNVFGLFVQPALFLGAMGLGVGGLVDDDGAAALGSIDYVAFVVPGLLVATAMVNAAGDGLWGVMAGTKWMGFYVGLTSTPMTPADVYSGVIAWHGVRATMSAVPFLLVGTAVGGVTSWWAVLAVIPAVLTGMLSIAALASYSITKQDDYSFSLIMRLAIMPLFLLSGTFFPVDQLPDAVQPVAWVLPLWHAAEAARDLTTGTPGLATALHTGLLAALVVAVWPLGARGFTRRLHA